MILPGKIIPSACGTMRSAPSQALMEEYMEGSCHVFAIASQKRHGGMFLLVRDESTIGYVDADGDEYGAILHVLAVHDHLEGMIARDIQGDRRYDPSAIKAEMAEIYDLWEEDISLNLADKHELLYHIENDDGVPGSLLGIDREDWASDEWDRPLYNFSESCLSSAAALDEVLAAPGERSYHRFSRHDEPDEASQLAP